MQKEKNKSIAKANVLFDQIKTGDQKALELLFAIYFPRLNDFAKNVIKDDGLSQDIVQEVFVKVWEQRTQIESQNIEAYLFRLVRNRCIDYIKHLRVVNNQMNEIQISSKYEELYRIDFIGNEPYLVCRYADAMLILGEAITENSGPTSEAVGYINQVRTRAGIGNLPAAAIASKAALRDAIFVERGHELYFEGLHKQDLIRMGKWTSALATVGKTAGLELFPVPEYAINNGNGQLTQTPGY